jgi:signal transduction histidine kinase
MKSGPREIERTSERTNAGNGPEEADRHQTRGGKAPDAQGAKKPGTPPSGPATTDREPVTSLARFALTGFYVALLLVSYYLAARLGLTFRFEDTIPVVWPAIAVYVSALVLTSKRHWWLVVIVTAFAHTVTVGPLIPVWRLLWQIAGNSIFALGTAEALLRFAGLPLHFETRRQVFAYTVIALVMSALFGLTPPAFILSWLRIETYYSPGIALLRALLSNATALLLVAPVVLLWANYDFRKLPKLSRGQFYEAFAIVVLLFGVGSIVLVAGPRIARVPGALLWIFTPVLWAAFRFGPLGASTTLLFVAALSTWGTQQKLGPFVLETGANRVLCLQLFWMALWLPVTLLAAVIREREVSERVLQDQRNQLAHVTRVAIAAEFSASLAHELRQPLASILLNTSVARHLLTGTAPKLDEARTILNEIEEQNKRAASIMSRAQSILKKDALDFESLAIETLVRDALVLGRGAISTSGVEVQTRIADGLPRVLGDPVQLLQVLLNLIVNACESMSSIPASDRRLLLQAARLGDEQLEVLITDSGVGLPAGGEERVFEPFFTTKENGLGLGLAIGRSIATAHGGRLWGENNPQGGATFHLVLPTEPTAV